MVLTFRLLLASLCLVAIPLVSAPVEAHKNPNESQSVQQNASEQAGAMSRGMSMQHQGGSLEDNRPTTLSGRLVDFLGRMHPFAVHFPIALIPAS